MYDSDLSDEEWGLLEHHFQRQDNRGARSVHAKRDVVNAILYLNKTGAQWRMLPKSFPSWQTVYADSREWNWRGAWEKALDELNALQRKKIETLIQFAFGARRAAIFVNCCRAASKSSAISAAMMSGVGSESVSVRVLPLIQKRSRLSLSRFNSSS
jgi:transposase